MLVEEFLCKDAGTVLELRTLYSKNEGIEVRDFYRAFFFVKKYSLVMDSSSKMDKANFFEFHMIKLDNFSCIINNDEMY